MAAASTLSPALSAATGAAAASAAGSAFVPARRRSPSPGAALRSAAVNNAAAAARCPPNDPNLRTPVSGTYPSSLHSPRPGSLTPLIKTPSDPEKTPLTPPSAYIDFLRTLSPNPYTGSPLSTGTSFSFSASASSPRWPSSAALSGKALSPMPRSFPAPRSFGDSRSAASPRPSSAVSSAAMSAAAGLNMQRDSVSAPPASNAATAPRANSGRAMKRPGDLSFTSGRLPPTNLQSVPSPTGIRPQSARQNSAPKLPSLVIPPSPSSSVTSMSPNQQHSAPARSAYPSSAHPDKSAVPSSAVSNKGRSPLSACVSASEGGTSSPVTIRHVVTRTVTYRRPAGGSAASAVAAAGGNGGSSGVTSAPRQARARMQSPLSAVEAVSSDDDDDEEEDKEMAEAEAGKDAQQEDGKRQPPRLIGDVPKGKRRKVEF